MTEDRVYDMSKKKKSTIEINQMENLRGCQNLMEDVDLEDDFSEDDDQINRRKDSQPDN